ncbi:TPA: acetyl-CoA carboxylase biotin carboxyl carrier protein subunit [Candidatus Woesearchaeota archaeon]|nr:acetyl-CoA carboxylase biotin carboxyl carrier protein subunit [Candidatus Woesearchaeota archaeon]
MKLKIDGKEFSVDIIPDGEGYLVSIGNNRIRTTPSDDSIRVNRRRHFTCVHKIADNTYNTSVDHDNYLVELVDHYALLKRFIRSPMQGTILSVDVKRNQKVKEGQTLVRILSMKMENEIKADADCTVKDIRVQNRQTVGKGDVLIELAK